MKICTKCFVPETQEGVRFDESGVCNVCRQIEYKVGKVNWKVREKEFIELVNQYKGKYLYDCIVPFSGGKDSTFTVWALVKRYKLKPLVVSFDHAFFRKPHLENVERTLKKLGVDYIRFKPNWNIIKKLMLESLKQKGDFCWHCHAGVFSFPMHIAIKFNIPLIVWGQPNAEYGSYYTYEDKEEVDEKRFNKFVNLDITAEKMLKILNDDSITLQDLWPYTYPKFKDLPKNCRSVCLGSYIPWDVKKQVKIIKKELGWKLMDVEGIPPEYDYEKVECAMLGVRDYLKYLKRGIGRTSHLMNIDIRAGQITKEEAKKFIEKYDGKRPISLDIFLDIVGLTEKEFNKIVLEHIVSPWKPDFERIEKGKRIEDLK